MAFPVVTAEGADIGASESLPGGAALRERARGLSTPRRSASYGHNWHAMLAAYHDCPPECTLSVDVEGWKGHSAGCGSAAAVEPLAWRVHNFNCWLIADGRAG